MAFETDQRRVGQDGFIVVHAPRQPGLRERVAVIVEAVAVVPGAGVVDVPFDETDAWPDMDLADLEHHPTEPSRSVG